MGPQEQVAAGSAEMLSIAKGAGFIGAGRIFSYIVRFAMAVLLARWLGPSDYGLYILAVSIAFAASGLSSLGLHTAMERFVAVSVRRDDVAGLHGAMQVAFVGTLLTSAGLSLALVVWGDPIADSLFDESDLGALLHVSAALTPLLALHTLLLAMTRGFKRMDVAALADDVAQPLVRLALLLGLAAGGMTAMRAGVALTGSYLVVVVGLLVVIRRMRGRVGVAAARRDIADIASFAFPFWFTGILRIIRTRLQPLLLGIFGATVDVGVFSVVTSANMLGRVANQAIRVALRPTLAELHDVGDSDEVGRLYATTTRWTLMVSLPVLIGMVAVPESLLELFGSGFSDGATPLVIAAGGEAINAFTGMCGPILAMSKHNRIKLVNAFVWMAVSLIASVVLIPIWGVTGAAIAGVISTAAINLLRVAEIWWLMRVVPWDRSTAKPIFAAMVTGAVAAVAVTQLPARLGLGALALFGLGVAVVFAAVVLMIGLESDDRLIADRLLRRIRRK